MSSFPKYVIIIYRIYFIFSASVSCSILITGRIFGPFKPERSDPITVQTDFQPLMDEEDDEIAAILKRLPVASSIPDSVSSKIIFIIFKC